MNAASAGRAPWAISAGERPPTLEIVLLKQTVILSWNQFVYAEGGDNEIRIAFASHDVVVRGGALSNLLSAISAHEVTSIREPTRSERFSAVGARFVSEIEIRRVYAD